MERETRGKAWGLDFQLAFCYIVLNGPTFISLAERIHSFFLVLSYTRRRAGPRQRISWLPGEKREDEAAQLVAQEKAGHL